MRRCNARGPILWRVGEATSEGGVMGIIGLLVTIVVVILLLRLIT
jgi:hypothetical protein